MENDEYEADRNNCTITSSANSEKNQPPFKFTNKSTHEDNHLNKESASFPLISNNHHSIDDKFIFFKKFIIGTGSFGKVIYGLDTNRRKEFAIKFEKHDKHSVIKQEINILKDLSPGVGIPNIYWHGKWNTYKVMVMDLLGPSLDKLFKINKRLKLETTALLGIEMINRIEYMHNKDYLHRDIKPNNFLLGKFSSKDPRLIDMTLYIIDFGLSKSYIKHNSGEHYQYKTGRRFVGTPRYASINTHAGIRQGRRDDLESIVYVLFYFLNGDLPWQGIKAKTKSEKKMKIKLKKQTVLKEELCTRDVKELFEILNYVKSLEFESDPNYDLIRQQLRCLLDRQIDLNNYLWEWDKSFMENANQDGKSEKIFDKLYEGYPMPTYADYVQTLRTKYKWDDPVDLYYF